MKTQQSRRYYDLMMGALNKAAQDFKEELHPRDASGRFSSKPGGGVATARGPRSLAREASALRAIGEMSEARKLEERLRQMRGGAARPRRETPMVAPPARRVPRRPAPAPAPRAPTPPGYVSDPARKKLPRPKEAQVAHERMRIDNAYRKARKGGAPFNDLMLRRMNAIGRPEKMMWFAEALEDENHHALAQHAREKLRSMGYDLNGNPIKKAEGAPRPAPAPAPPPPRPAAAPKPKVGRHGFELDPNRPKLPEPNHREVRHEQNRIDDFARGVSRDKFEAKIRRRIKAIGKADKLRNFAVQLAGQGYSNLAREAATKLHEMGYDLDGNAIKPQAPGGAAPAPAAAPARREPARRAPKAPPAKEEKPGKVGAGLQRAQAGSKHPMKALNTNIDLLDAANKDFKKNVPEIKRLGGREGIGKTFKMKLADGSRAIFKPTNGTGLQRYAERGARVRRTIDHKIPERARERAAYVISNAAGFDVVPYVSRVDYKDVEGPYKGDGHVMGWIDGKAAFEVGGSEMRRDYGNNHPDLHRIAALDFISCNTDRHGGNYMKGKDGRWYAIDNGLAFCNDQKTGEYRSSPHGHLSGRSIPQEVQEEIKSIDPKVIRREMENEGFPEIDIKGTLDRLSYLQGKTKWEDPYTEMGRVKGR